MLSNDIMHFIGFSLVIISIFFLFCSVIFFVKSVYSIFLIFTILYIALVDCLFIFLLQDVCIS